MYHFDRQSRAMKRLALSLIFAILNALLTPLAFSAGGVELSAVSRAKPTLIQAQADFIRQIPLTANDVVYSSSTGKLYASVPSSAGINGNSIATIDPSTGVVSNSVFVGSEPNKLALSDDRRTLYTALDGASSIRRFDVVTQTPGLQFALGQDSFLGPYRANDLAVAPGDPNLVAVARQHQTVSPPEAGVAVFDNGVQRPTTGPGHNSGSDFLAFSASASKLYGTGFSSGLTTFTVNSDGVTVASSTTLANGSRIKFDNNRIYSSSGQVIDADSTTLAGTFSGVATSAFVPDSSVGRAYYLVRDQFGSNNWSLKAFDINTFISVGSVSIPGISGDPTTLVRWGGNGLAFRTTGNQLFTVQTSLIPSADPIPTATPTPSPTPSPSPAYVPTFVRRVNLPANALVYSQATQSLYASVPSSAGSNGNSITKIVPDTAAVGPSVFVGSEPNRLALSDDGQTLYTSLDGANAIRRFDIPTETPGFQFPVSTVPLDLEVLPGSPQSVAVSRGTGSFGNGSVVIYDNGIQRSKTGMGSYYAVLPIEFGSSAATLYGYDSYSSGFELVKFAIDISGATTVSVTNNLLQGYINGFEYADGLLYSSGGRVADPEAKTLVGTFKGPGLGNVLAVDPTIGRVFFLSNNGSNTTLSAYDIHTFLPIGSVILTGISGNPGSLVRWGTNGLAFNTVNSFGSTNSSDVYLLQSELVSSSGTVPTGIQLNSATLRTFESSQNLSVTVSRTGNVSSATSVNYATSDGTATAGSDYTNTNGTLTFAVGELTKTINIPLLDDNFYEGGDETLTFTLSSATGGALLTTPSAAVITITDSEQKPSISVTSSLRLAEGNSGTKTFRFNARLSNPTFQVVTADFTTENGTATAGSDFVATSGTLTFQPGITSLLIDVTVNGDVLIEPDETFLVKVSNGTNLNFFSPFQVTATIANEDADATLQFSVAQSALSESDNAVTLTVTRTGDTSIGASVSYATSDAAGGANCNVINGAASSLCDYGTAAGTLQFAAGQTSKTISILIIDDSYAEGGETFSVTLSNASGGSLGLLGTATVTINDNENVNGANSIDTAQFFVREHYYDFLNRLPDQGGLNYWATQITACGNDAACVHRKRIDVSAAFYVELEFQRTGYVVYRLYRAAHGTMPNATSRANVTYGQFIADRGQLVDGAGLPQSTFSLTNAFVERPEFLQAYPDSLSNAQFVNKLFDTAQLVPYTTERQSQISAMNNSGKTRAQVLLDVVEIGEFKTREYNPAFVLMQYFGYLRRDPDQGGYDFWLDILNNRLPNNFRGMVCAFLTSAEYQQRFGASITRTNRDCSQ